MLGVRSNLIKLNKCIIFNNHSAYTNYAYGKLILTHSFYSIRFFSTFNLAKVSKEVGCISSVKPYVFHVGNDNVDTYIFNELC